MCGVENKKYRSVGNECRLSCCLVAIWSVCSWSPVKISVSFYVMSSVWSLLCRLLGLLVTLGLCVIKCNLNKKLSLENQCFSFILFLLLLRQFNFQLIFILFSSSTTTNFLQTTKQVISYQLLAGKSLRDFTNAAAFSAEYARCNRSISFLFCNDIEVFLLLICPNNCS